MSQNTALEEKLALIVREIRDLNSKSFTGKTTIELGLNQGGIRSISVIQQQDLLKK